MAVYELTQALAEELDAFERRRAEILADTVYSEGKKKSNVQEFTNQKVYTCTNLITRLWGALTTQDDGRTILEAGAACWRELDAAERAVTQARQEAERAGVNAAYVEHTRLRAQALINACSGPGEMLRAYEEAAEDVRRALQDYGAAMLPPAQYHGTGNESPALSGKRIRAITFEELRRRFERDRQTRVYTPAVKLAEQAHAVKRQQVKDALTVTKRAANLLAAHSYYLSVVLRGVAYRMEAVPGQPGAAAHHFERVPWGVERATVDGKTMRFSMSGN